MAKQLFAATPFVTGVPLFDYNVKSDAINTAGIGQNVGFLFGRFKEFSDSFVEFYLFHAGHGLSLLLDQY